MAIFKPVPHQPTMLESYAGHVDIDEENPLPIAITVWSPRRHWINTQPERKD